MGEKIKRAPRAPTQLCVVTQQMSSAGVAVLEASGRLRTDYAKLSDALLVRDIYLAMQMARYALRAQNKSKPPATR